MRSLPQGARRLAFMLALIAACPAAAQPQPGAPAQQPGPAAPPSVSAPVAPAAPPGPATEASTASGRDGPAPQALAPGPRVHELSPWSMFMGADLLVKGVMVGLALASLVTWTIFLAKIAELATARRRLRATLGRLGRCESLDEADERLGGGRDVLAELIRETVAELRLSAGVTEEPGLKERVQSLHADIMRVEGRSVRRGLGLLATIGSISPFVGLFGTVWGIMNSFIGISKAQTTNLAVVAPGIAEALLATAIGLVAAIPAVIIYNHFSRSTKSYLDLAARASGAVGRLMSRDLDRARLRAYPQAAE